MKARAQSSENRKNERGVALVITLAILVIATILVVAFVTSMRTERQSANSMANNTVAGVLAQSALDHAISILDKNIPQPVPPGGSIANPTNWIVSPGLLTTVQGTSNPIQIPLSSNPTASYASTNQDAELNVPLLSGSGYAILPTSASMKVAWIPVLKDPTTTASSANPISGRYGFWIDDENNKININTAIGKPASLDFSKLTPGTISANSATYPLGHPSSVNLDMLGALDTANLITAVSQRDGLASIDSIKPYVSGGSADAYVTANKFFLTAHSRVPDFNVFGKSKMYFVQSVKTRQLGYPLFQFFRDKDGPPYFPAEENATADRHALYYVANALWSYFGRRDWPGMPARSFVDKWDHDKSGNPYTGLKTGEMGEREASQVAWNVMTLGMFAAGDFSGASAATKYSQLVNTTKSGELGYVSKNEPNTDAVLSFSSLGNQVKALLPQYPTPRVNEVALAISPEYYTDSTGADKGQPKYRLKASLTLEVWVPPHYPAYDFSSGTMSFGATYLSYNVTQGSKVCTQEDSKYLASANPNGVQAFYSSLDSSAGVANPNDFLQVVTTFPIYIVQNVNGFHTDNSFAAAFTGAGGIITFDFKIRLYARGPGATSQLIPVWDTHDPISKTAATTWDGNPSQSATSVLSPPPDDPKDYVELSFSLDPSQFGNAPTPYTRSLEVADPRMSGLAKVWQPASDFSNQSNHDADSLGKINNSTTAANYDTNKIAFVDLSSPGPSSNRASTGFLSFIDSGMQRGIAGSTLKFQPSASNADLPDWLLVDLVAPNAVAADYSKMSFMNSTAGLINVNAKIFPTGGSFAPPVRWEPLEALLENMPGVTAGSNESTVVSNIINHATTGTDFGAPGLFDYPGEICEITGVADTGSSDWDKEAIIRNIASCLTTKSNVFSVWGVAQTVKKNPVNTNPGVFETKAGGATADDIVTGERRFQAVVERYVWPGNDNTPGEGHVPSTGGTYDELSASATQPGFAPPYSGGAWEMLDGPAVSTYPILTTDPWTKNVKYGTSTIDAANNPVAATIKYRVVYFRYLTD